MANSPVLKEYKEFKMNDLESVSIIYC